MWGHAVRDWQIEEISVITGASVMVMGSKAGVDRFRIKIWDATTGQVMYDNQPGAANNADALGGIASGSIVIHK